MIELSDDELLALTVLYGEYGENYGASIKVVELSLTIHQVNAEPAIKSLIEKNIIRRSPDGDQIKFTESGIKVYLRAKSVI